MSTPEDENGELPMDAGFENEVEAVATEAATSQEDDSHADVLENEDRDYTPSNPKVNFNHSRPVSVPLKEGEDPQLADSLSICRESYPTLVDQMNAHEDMFNDLAVLDQKVARNLLEQNKELTDRDGQHWLRVILDSLANAQINNTGLKATARDGSQWEQSVDEGEVKLRPGKPVQRLKPGGNHSKEEMLSYIQRKANTGAVYDFPLWHSGVWIRVRAPYLADLTALQHELSQARVNLGNETKGLAFSNSSQTMTSIAVNFVLQHVIASNVNFRTPSDLKEKIVCFDTPALLLALAASMFPNGYPYQAPCVADPSKCRHVVKERLQLDRLLWTDVNALTKAQRKHMSTRFSVVRTDEELAEYRKQHVNGGYREIWFADFGLRLKSPNLLEQEVAGVAWIDGIVEMTHGAFNEPPHGTNRNRYITQLGHATTARQYAHFVDSVLDRENEDEESAVVVEDADVVATILANVLSSDELAEDFFTKVSSYIDDCLIAMVAIPSYNCPACGTPTATKFHQRFEHLVPLDVLTTFFTLTGRKLN